ncbi:MATE family efflux transporter [Intestinimonas massiliensis (ex Afouda et al. 2020)]|uniref:MATE family efflux transporter n=1 Tax=Intestinimonas massiliensis (ex Afouda et al. 2020) TaxID=1673721 RepID=UPI00102F99AE|nr:MATE family efflux transporter [Intestinimonas massiliensis (ex Afouda et al. 2020)]
MAKRENDLGRDPVGKLLLRLAVPSVTAQLVNALYNIVDRMYIGHIEGVGDLALTGLGVCFPVLMFVSAISSLVGMGGGSRAVVRMGEGKEDQANAILGSCSALLIVLAVAATAFFQVVKEPMLLLFGATPETIGYASDYLTIYLWGSIFVELSLGLNFFITAQGFSTMSMATVLIGAVTNIVLDPILIFGFNMGVKGAALATITAQAVSAVWVVRFLTGKRTKLKLQRRFFRVNFRVLAPVLALGVSPFIMNSTESLVNIAFNSSLKAYGGNPAVGAMTICSSVMQIFFLLLQGLAQGAQPIIGFNYGSGQLDRVKKACRLLVTCALTFSCAACAALELFPGLFVGLFNDKPELVETAVWALRVYAGGMFILGIQTSCQQSFVALGQAKVSLFLALLRKIILLIPLILILPHIFSDQVFAVFLAEPVADIAAAITTGSMFLWRFPRILEHRRAELAEKKG